ncbi:sorting nexin [Mortierella sp. GBA30]|nr:sorting nexin [Mortierella sp. GBA30]
MSAPEENEDAMTASFSASTYDSEVNDPWTATVVATSPGESPVDLSTLLSGMPLPAIYTTAFDLAQPSGGKVTVLAVNKIIGVSGLPPAVVDKIMNIVVAPTRSRITKGECSVALALVAMAQKSMDLTIENLTAHREDLPIPHLPGLENIDFGSTADTSASDSTSTVPKHHPVNVGSTMSDPWRNSTYKGNGYPPPPSYLASPPLASADSTTAHDDPEATRQEIHQWFLNLDTIRITFAPEKEGIFLFKHTNYIVESKELALWRKNVVISTEDEFTSQLPIPETLSKQVPMNLDLQVENLKRRLPASIEYYRSMVHVMDRVQKRTEATAADFMRFSLALNALADSEKQCHVEDCYNCGQLSQGYGKIGSHMSQTSSVLEEQGRAMQRGVVEDLKRRRDLLVSVKELLERQDRDRARGEVWAKMLQKRNATNEAKLKSLQASAAAAAAAAVEAARGQGGASAGSTLDPSSFDAQIEKITHNLNLDRANLETMKQRSVLLRHTLWMEITYYHKNQAMIATLYQKYVHEQIKSSQSLKDNWKSLSPFVHELPMEVNGFN